MGASAPILFNKRMVIEDCEIEKVLEGVTFYADAIDKTRVYAEYQKDDDRVHFQSIDSEDFAACLRIWYKRVSGKTSKRIVDVVRTQIKDERNYFAAFPEVEPKKRVAGSLKTGIEYYLADSNNYIVAVSNGNWEVRQSQNYRFITSNSQLKQVTPQKTELTLVELLAQLVNLKGDDLILFAVWLAQCFSGGAHYGLLLAAERGSAKSTMTRLINQILDPSGAMTMQMQSKLEDFQDVLADNYLCCYDNLRTIPVGHSDSLAAAITGSTVAKRVLYTTRDVSYVKLLNVIVLNGVNLFASESDLAERFLYFELKKLTPSQLRPDNEIETLFSQNRSLILGAIFDVLAKATMLVKQPVSVKPTRMSQAFFEMVAIAKAMGISECRFDEIIRANIASMQRASAVTPLVQAVAEYMDGPAFGRRKITEKSTAFFKNVTANYSGQRSTLPSSAAAFSKRLKAERDGLAAAGFSSIVDDTGPVSSTITIIRDKK